MLHARLQETSREQGARRSGLHVLFVAGGDGLAAQLAAHWTRVLANGRLQVKAVGADRMDLTKTLDRASEDLAVVIHDPGNPGPLLVPGCGGRIDWHLDGDAVAKCPTDRVSQLRSHVMLLLGELGITQAHPEAAAPVIYPSVLVDPPKPVFDTFLSGRTGQACLQYEGTP